MYFRYAIKHTAPFARSLTDSYRYASVRNPNSPLGLVLSNYHNPVKPNRKAFTTTVALESENAVAESNDELNPIAAAVVETEVEKLVSSCETLLFNIRNVLIPSVELLQEGFVNEANSVKEAVVEVESIGYHHVHDTGLLIDHLATRYALLDDKLDYRTFILDELTPTQIVEMVANNNQHIEPADITDWLLTMGAEKVSRVWQSLFSRVIGLREINNLPWCKANNSIYNADSILLAYLILGSFIDKPLEGVGGNISLEEWNRRVGNIHHFFGYKLKQVYAFRTANLQKQILILKKTEENPIETGVFVVTVNGDIYPAAKQQGVTDEAILGAARYTSELSLPAIKAQQDALIERWGKYRLLIETAANDRYVKNRKQTLFNVFRKTSSLLPEGIPQLDENELSSRLNAELRAVKDCDFDCIYSLLARLVCNIYYQDISGYKEFIEAHLSYSALRENATPQELATEGIIEVVANWLVKQITVASYKQEVSLSKEPVEIE